MAGYTLDGGREILWRYIQPFGIVAHIALRSTDACVMKICLHGCKITHIIIYKQTFSAKSENHGAICETGISKNHRNFAAEIKRAKIWGVFEQLRLGADVEPEYAVTHPELSLRRL